jgi:outer membrane protein assembly factor BamB
MIAIVADIGKGYYFLQQEPDGTPKQSLALADSIPSGFWYPVAKTVDDSTFVVFGNRWARMLRIAASGMARILWERPLDFQEPIVQAVAWEDGWIVGTRNGTMARFDSSGQLVWRTSFNFSVLQALQSTPAGILGCYRSQKSSVFLIAPAAGQLVWQKEVPLSRALAVAARPDGGYLVAGQDADQMALLAVGADGSEQWRRHYGKGYINALHPEPDGHILLLGWAAGGVAQNLRLIRADRQGNTALPERFPIRGRTLENAFLKAFLEPKDGFDYYSNDSIRFQIPKDKGTSFPNFAP